MAWIEWENGGMAKVQLSFLIPTCLAAVYDIIHKPNIECKEVVQMKKMILAAAVAVVSGFAGRFAPRRDGSRRESDRGAGEGRGDHEG